MKKKFRIVSLLLTVVLLMSVYVTPVAAQGNGRGQEEQSAQLLLTEPLSEEAKQLMNSHDSEIEIVNGSPAVVLSGRNGNMYFPLNLPAVMDILLNGKPVTVKVEGNYLLIPLDGEYEKICISEFDVNVASDGQIVLVGYINPILIAKIIVAVYKVAKPILVAIATIGGAVAFWNAIHDGFTSRAIQTRVVNRSLTRGHWMTVGGFNFSVPRPLRAARVSVRVTDVDTGEVVRVSLVGAGRSHSLGRLSATGNNVTKTLNLTVNSNDLDTMDALFRDTQGRPSVRIEKTHGSTVVVNNVGIALNW